MLTNLKIQQHSNSITVLQFYFKASPFFRKNFILYIYLYIYNIKFFQKKGDALK